MNSQNQSEAQNYNQHVTQQASQSFFSNGQPRATVDCSKIFPLFQQNKNVTNKHLKRSQSHYSEDEDYYSQNQQCFKANQQKINQNFDKIRTN